MAKKLPRVIRLIALLKNREKQLLLEKIRGSDVLVDDLLYYYLVTLLNSSKDIKGIYAVEQRFIKNMGLSSAIVNNLRNYAYKYITDFLVDSIRGSFLREKIDLAHVYTILKVRSASCDSALSPPWIELPPYNDPRWFFYPPTLWIDYYLLYLEHHHVSDNNDRTIESILNAIKCWKDVFYLNDILVRKIGFLELDWNLVANILKTLDNDSNKPPNHISCIMKYIKYIEVFYRSGFLHELASELIVPLLNVYNKIYTMEQAIIKNYPESQGDLMYFVSSFKIKELIIMIASNNILWNYIPKDAQDEFTATLKNPLDDAFNMLRVRKSLFWSMRGEITIAKQILANIRINEISNFKLLLPYHVASTLSLFLQGKYEQILSSLEGIYKHLKRHFSRSADNDQWFAFLKLFISTYELISTIELKNDTQDKQRLDKLGNKIYQLLYRHDYVKPIGTFYRWLSRTLSNKGTKPTWLQAIHKLEDIYNTNPSLLNIEGLFPLHAFLTYKHQFSDNELTTFRDFLRLHYREHPFKLKIKPTEKQIMSAYNVFKTALPIIKRKLEDASRL